MPSTELPPAIAALVATLELATDFPPAVLDEVRAWEADPRIDDPTLVDATDVPFVTIDAATSRDLDQALHVARTPEGYRVLYAIADAAFYVRPGSALFDEALRRGATYYVAGFAIPMLPRALSEGLVSLMPEGPRRALVFEHRLDAEGQLLGTTLTRARIRSRRKLAFEQVQALVDGASDALAGAEFAESLFLLREVGRKRMALGAARGLVRYRREEVHVALRGEAGGGVRFAAMDVVRDEVERWNEQLSLLCNAEGGRLLHEHPDPAVQPIYRVHPGPDPEKLAELAALTEALVRVHELPSEPWKWDAERESLAAYLDALPTAPHGSREERLVRALTRQAVMVNLRSSYSTEAGPHVGVGAEPYARFSAPMREIVGVFLHKEAVEMLTGAHPPLAEDEALRSRVVEVANRARDVQRELQNRANELVLEGLLRPDLELPPAARTPRVGTITGITASKVHVHLDAPPIDVKVYVRDLGNQLARARGARQSVWLELGDHGAWLRERGTERVLLRLGDPITLRVDRFDVSQRRWVLHVDLDATSTREH